jgi:hypothetical protein
MELNITVPRKVEAKTLSIYCKVRDRFTANILDDQGNVLGGQDDGYVPDFMPGTHYGDYVSLDIDIDTGMVTNWVTPEPKDIESFINGSSEDE